MRPTISQCIDAVERETGVTRAELLRQDRRPPVVVARHLAYWLPWVTGTKKALIGRKLQRDHRTIGWGIEQVERKRAADEDFRALADRCLHRVSAPAFRSRPAFLFRMSAYYSDNDPFCCAWLRNLIGAGLIADGVVDDRPIQEIQPSDLAGFTQCHFFAGIGGWSYALRLAGWPDDRPVWTGSCPCQPFSAAEKRKGTSDVRHLWPEFKRLVAECGPPTVFGEQVASKDGRRWLAGVRADLEALGYGVGGADLCAAGVGAPHIRQRLYWMADAGSEGRRQEPRSASSDEGKDGRQSNCGHVAASGGTVSGLADANGRCESDGHLQRGRQHRQQQAHGSAVPERLGDATSIRLEGAEPLAIGERVELQQFDACRNNFWSDSILIPCSDGKARPIEPGSFPLAHGVPNRMGRLRGYGNAIVPQVAAEFIRSFMEVQNA